MQFPSLYSKTSKGKLNIWTIWTEGNTIHTEWGEVGGTLQTNSVKVGGKNAGRANATSDNRQAELEAQSKWAAKKLKKYYDSPEAAMDTLNIKPMTAYPLDTKRKESLVFPVAVQPKYDGVRCMAYLRDDGSVRLMSRGGKDYKADHIEKELKPLLTPGMCLDGELYIHGESLQNIRHLQANEDPRLKYYVYDLTSLPPDNTGYKDRYERLSKLIWDNPHVKLADTSLDASSMEEIQTHHDWFVEHGYEGAMVRTLDGPYKLAGRSQDLLKYKMFQDAEFLVVGVKQGKDEVPLFVCIQEEGLEFDVRPMGTAEERKEMLDNKDSFIGQKLTVKFQHRSDDNVPLFGVGVSFRPEEDRDA